MLAQYESKMASIGQVNRDGVVGKVRKCFTEAIESNPSWDLYMKGLENYMDQTRVVNPGRVQGHFCIPFPRSGFRDIFLPTRNKFLK